jgi:hypothetical protein
MNDVQGVLVAAGSLLVLGAIPACLIFAQRGVQDDVQKRIAAWALSKQMTETTETAVPSSHTIQGKVFNAQCDMGLFSAYSVPSSRNPTVTFYLIPRHPLALPMTYLWRNDSLELSYIQTPRVQTQDQEFESRFALFSDSGKQAIAFLSPDLRQALLSSPDCLQSLIWDGTTLIITTLRSTNSPDTWDRMFQILQVAIRS